MHNYGFLTFHAMLRHYSYGRPYRIAAVTLFLLFMVHASNGRFEKVKPLLSFFGEMFVIFVKQFSYLNSLWFCEHVDTHFFLVPAKRRL